MDSRVKKLWIEALTSGEYEQGQGVLRSDGTFCCLGVLCDLHRKEIGGKWIKADDSVVITEDIARPVYTYNSLSTILPRSVYEWAGLTGNNRDNPTIDDSMSPTLAEKNDAGIPFLEIAKLIEQHL